MLNLARTHDFQVQLSPSKAYPAAVNPPSFNWPEATAHEHYTLELKHPSSDQLWRWEQVNSPMQLSHELPIGQYQWRLMTSSAQQPEQVSDWIDFQITEAQPNYLAPTANELFEQCDGHEQWLMYFDEDIQSVKAHSSELYPKLKHTASLSVPLSEIRYPSHYQRGQEEGKREAIANAREWIDRDLMVHALLYRVWGEEAHGQEAMSRLLQLAEWSTEGPASLLQPCTWGDEVGCSLARNLFIAYHWLSPLLNDNEKGLFIRPMLVRIARQIMERLAQDNFKQYPGHSHTSRLPAYLGLAGLALYREHDRAECEQWLTEALTIYRGILPFYGGIDGSWVEGPFYASTYSKWFHPFFLSVERLSGFSFYQHPFYQNFLSFAQDFIAPEQSIHPFSDGFWCRREGKEWPGFFAQNPLRIYAARFGDALDYQQSLALERAITDYRLHLLDLVPTVKQIAFNAAAEHKQPSDEKLAEQQALSHYYTHAGLGKLTQQGLSLYYRASAFGNSSHRHGDQGNVSFFDNNIGVLVPTGSYGYRFGSKHHSQWTRQTIAHNLPLVSEQGQKLDDQSAVGLVVNSLTESNCHIVTLDLSESYAEPLERFYRTLVLVEAYGLIIVDSIELSDEHTLHWRLHSPLSASVSDDQSTVLLSDPATNISQYKCHILSHLDVQLTLAHGYEGELTIPERAIESDASKEIVHLDWQLPLSRTHSVVACCIKEGAELPKIRYSTDNSGGSRTVSELLIGEQVIPIAS
ncbi:heparinase II/III domain-containing protein [Leucothrix mucor]|uniref:heparinase II/III domain-containing protein n=1 Tax=Leucothrix mucor TaxID=45248 RepID=UPI0003B6C5C5|nr:heparinase II/III family protein [Leucothrix mucor]